MLDINLLTDEELIKAIVKFSGETESEAVTQALRERLAHFRRIHDKEGITHQIEETLKCIDAMPIRDRRSADELVGYDEYGLPT